MHTEVTTQNLQPTILKFPRGDHWSGVPSNKGGKSLWSKFYPMLERLRGRQRYRYYENLLSVLQPHHTQQINY